MPVRSPGDALRMDANFRRGRDASMRGRSTGYARSASSAPGRAHGANGRARPRTGAQDRRHRALRPSSCDRPAPGREQARTGAKLVRLRARRGEMGRGPRTEVRTCTHGCEGSAKVREGGSLRHPGTRRHPAGAPGPRTGAHSDGPGRPRASRGHLGPKRRGLPAWDRERARTAAKGCASGLPVPVFDGFLVLVLAKPRTGAHRLRMDSFGGQRTRRVPWAHARARKSATRGRDHGGFVMSLRLSRICAAAAAWGPFTCGHADGVA